MKVLFLMISYPDVAENTNMYTDLTNEFLRNGHVVYVAAPGNQSTKLFKEGGIDVLRIKTLPLFNTSLIKKGIATLLLPSQYKAAIIKYFGKTKFDLIVTATPPITFSQTIRYLKKKSEARFYLILRDIFPQNAKDLGIINNPLVFAFFRRKEKKLYRIADSIGCMSQKNIDFIIERNPEVECGKLQLLPNWVRVKEADADLPDFKDVALNSKFIAVFGGNFGIPQKTDFLIEVAEKLNGIPDILFLLIGNGTEKERVRREVIAKQLKNVLILDQLPNNQYLSLLKNCHIGLVNLSDKFTIPNIPSRTLSYWSLKIPVLAAVDRNTDYGQLLERAEGGLWSIIGDTDTYISNLLFLYNNPDKRKQMGQNGFNYLIKELNTTNTFNAIMSRLN
jgi:glycosyltransferase involved in cell wall biosynthesis